ncbi:NADH-ubiquinone reductase complex 1 MLRQ subunit, partial [Cynara cardunculus var. scolymus]
LYISCQVRIRYLGLSVLSSFPFSATTFVSLLSSRLLCFPFSGVAQKVEKMGSSTLNRWLRPEVYPLFAAVGVAVGICGMQLIRNISSNPEVRVNKENRAAGVLDNFAEGEKYAEHSLRKFVRNKDPEIMPSINSFFADPK